MLALALACTKDDPTDPLGQDPPPFVTPPTTPPILPFCVPDPAVHIEGMTITPLSFSQASIEVTLSEPADVAVACTSLDDPTEVHLLEGQDAAQYTFALGGLLADTHYRCEAVAVCPTSLSPGIEADLYTDPAPSYTPTATASFDPNVRMTGAYTLTNAQPDCTGGPDRDQWLVIWDPFGRPRWLYTLPLHLNVGIEARWHGNNTIVWGGGDHGNGAPAKVDLFGGEFYKTTFPGASALKFHHDGKMLPDGRMLTTSETLEHDWASFQLHIIDADTNGVDWSYHSDEAVSQGAIRPDGYYDTEDPWHLNWADVVGNQAIVSLCHTWMIAAIGLETRSVDWRFGINGDFAIVDAQGDPLDDSHFPQCQHGLEFDGRSLLIYDNGSYNDQSRATEFELDIQSKIATQTWMWTEPGWFETSLGDVDWLTADHQRVLVTQAHPECFSPSPASVSQITEVDRSTNTPIHRLVFDEPETTNYRAERIDGCAIFNNTAYCQTLTERLVALRPLFER